MSALVQILIGAVLQGSLYALGAIGLSLSFGVLKILNLSHGDFVMLGGLFGFFALVKFGVNPFYSAGIIAVLGLLIGAVYYRFLIKRILGRSDRDMLIASVIITLGVSIIIEDLTSTLWGGGSTGIPFKMPNLIVDGIVFPLLRVTLLAITVVLILGLHYFLKRSFIGRAIVASAMNPIGAVVVGINVDFVAMATFALGIALASASGVFYAALYSIEPFMGLDLTLKYLAVIVVGGMGSLLGAIIGGVVVATSEALTSYYLGAQWSPMVAFIILIVALLVRPQGLVGKKD
jgi:branched-chain amino acid transport system permease protein